MTIIIQRNNGSIELELPEPTIYFYRFHNTQNDKSYVGRTKNPARRISQHMSGEGSPALLADLVNYGREAFDITIIDTGCSDEEANYDILEDYYIRKFNAVSLGYNLRYNAPIVPNGEYIDLNEIRVCAKYNFVRNNRSIFSVGQFTQADSYQVLCNVVEQLGDTPYIPITQKKKKFHYFELQCEGEGSYVPGQTYELWLRYNMIANTLTL